MCSRNVYLLYYFVETIPEMVLIICCHVLLVSNYLIKSLPPVKSS